VELAGVLPVDVKLHRKPRGHGYAKVVVDRPNPIFPVGSELRGHEFHYSALSAGRDDIETAYRVEKGSGVGEGRDGIVHEQVLASYLHLHALGTPAWAPGLVAAARAHAAQRNPTDPDA
jgi:cobyrinic acid a,c-diamide synthase